jgi:hypothetical protein
MNERSGGKSRTERRNDKKVKEEPKIVVTQIGQQEKGRQTVILKSKSKRREEHRHSQKAFSRKEGEWKHLEVILAKSKQ